MSFNCAEGETADVLRRWLESFQHPDDHEIVPFHTYGILYKSEDNMLFPFLFCNAGALPVGMEIRNENGLSVKDAPYVSPALSSSVTTSDRPFHCHCDSVLELPYSVRESFKSVCAVFHKAESPAKPFVIQDCRAVLDELSQYAMDDKDISKIHRCGTQLIAQFDNMSFWNIALSVRNFERLINEKINKLPYDWNDSSRDRDKREEAVSALKSALYKVSAPSALDIAPFEKKLNSVYLSDGESDKVSEYYFFAMGSVKILKKEKNFSGLANT